MQGSRSGWRLCGKILFGDKPSHLNICYFHDLCINIYCGKKKTWGIPLWATLVINKYF
jgi:hypothetical protein